MNQELLTKICNEIKSCPNWKNGSLECGRDETAIPKTVKVRNTQKILLITRDPSNQANKLDNVTNFENLFFRDKVLPILFEDYETEKAKNDRKYFESFRESFLSIFYWTHYQKCFPGKRNGAHKQPRKECANKYLKREIEAFGPEIIICMGGKATEYVTGEKMLHAISKNGSNYVIYSGKKIPLIALTHPSNANNGAKNHPSYRYEETIKLIHEKVSSFQKKIHEKKEVKKQPIEIKIRDKAQEKQINSFLEETEKYREPISPPALKKSTMDQLDLYDPFLTLLKKRIQDLKSGLGKKLLINESVSFISEKTIR